MKKMESQWTTPSLFPFIIEVRTWTPQGISIKHLEFTGRSTSQSACPQPTGESGEEVSWLHIRAEYWQAEWAVSVASYSEYSVGETGLCTLFSLCIVHFTATQWKQKMPRAGLWSQVWVLWHLAVEQLAKETPHSSYTLVTEVHKGEQRVRITLQPLPFIKG